MIVTAAREGYERLERYDWKLSRTVLRREEAGNRFFLFGGCFDNIDHRILMKLIRKEIADRPYTSLIRKFLRAGYVENGMKRTPETGTPQGGIFSPLLANIYLHEMDMWWLKNYWGTKGTRQRRRAKGLGNFLLIRYADDSIFLSNATRKIVEETKELLAEFLQKELKLELSKEKTVIKHITEGFDFLGFHVRRYKNTKVTLIQPTRKNTQRIRDRIDGITDRRQHNTSVMDTIRTLNPVIRGWANYYQYVNSSKTLVALDYYLTMKFYKWYRGKYRMSYKKGTRKAKRWVNGEQPYQLTKFTDTKVKRRKYQKEDRENPYINISKYSECIQENPIVENPMVKVIWYGYEERNTNLRMECLIRDKGTCQICKMCRAKMIVHHKIPIYLGGADTIDNLVTICEDCEKKYRKILHHSRTGWQELLQLTEKAHATDGEPCAVKVASTVRRRGGEKHTV